MNYVETLSERDIDFGRKMWQLLRKNKKFPVRGVFWLLEPDASDWQLVIASPRVDTVGPRDAYRELALVTETLGEAVSQSLRIGLISPKQSFYQALRSVFGKTESVEGARLGNTQVSGMFINDAYLYEIR